MGGSGHPGGCSKPTTALAAELCRMDFHSRTSASACEAPPPNRTARVSRQSTWHGNPSSEHVCGAGASPTNRAIVALWPPCVQRRRSYPLPSAAGRREKGDPTSIRIGALRPLSDSALARSASPTCSTSNFAPAQVERLIRQTAPMDGLGWYLHRRGTGEGRDLGRSTITGATF